MPDDARSNVAPLGIREYLAVLYRRRIVLVLVTLAVFGIGLYASMKATPMYKAGGEVLLRVEAGQTGTVPTEAKVIESEAVHILAVESDPRVGEVSTSADPTVNLITVTAESEKPQVAAATVNEHMDAYVAYTRQAELNRYLTAVKVLQPVIDDLQKQIDALAPQALLSQDAANRRAALIGEQLGHRARLQEIQLDTTLAGAEKIVVAEASPPSSPVSPKPTRDALIALGAGLLLAVAAAFIVELFDERIRSVDDLQRSLGELPVLAMIPAMRPSRNGLVTLVAPRSPGAEAYRSLRTGVQFVGIERGTCIEVTSSRAGEGKSVTTANLAVALAQAGQRVIVVDADLRGPSLHKLFGLPNEVGFTSVLLGQPLIEALQPVPHVSNLAVLTSGPLPPNPSEILASDRCREVLRALRTEAAVVLIDTPPLLAVTDPAVLAGLVDAVVLMARIRVSTRRQVRRSVQLMSQMGAPLVGAVLNSATDSGHAYYHHVPRPRARRLGRLVESWRRRRLQSSVADPDRTPESGRSRTGPINDDDDRTPPPRPEVRNRPGSPLPAPPVKPRSRF